MEIRKVNESMLSAASDEELLIIAEAVSKISDMVASEIYSRLSGKLEANGWIRISSTPPPINIRIHVASAYSGATTTGVAVEDNGALGVHLEMEMDAPTHWKMIVSSSMSIQ